MDIKDTHMIKRENIKQDFGDGRGGGGDKKDGQKFDKEFKERNKELKNAETEAIRDLKAQLKYVKL